MAVGVTVMLFVKDSGSFYHWAEWTNQHPQGLPLWPVMFITIACGALSGFHATQSPLMARCMGNEKQGRSVFYGAMIAEGFIGLVWATVGMTFYPDPAALNTAIDAGTASQVVYDSSLALLGPIGGVLAILGVIVLPITSGDTAFRAARLTIADTLGLSQVERAKRLYVAVPLFAIGILLSQVDFNVIWRYCGWSNQTLAAIALWAGAAYLYRRGRLHWIATAPAVFITAASVTYICYEPNMGFRMSIDISYVIGVVAAVAALAAFLMLGKKEVAGAPTGV